MVEGEGRGSQGAEMLDADPETRMATHMRCGVCCTASGENFEGKEAREFSTDGRQKKPAARGWRGGLGEADEVCFRRR